MHNKSISDFIANAMDATLKSAEHQALFNTQYKYASEKCEKCSKDKGSCMCDSGMADDNDAKKGVCKECGKPNFLCKCDKSKADDNDARKHKDSSDENDARKHKDSSDENDARKHKDSSSEDSSHADDNEARKHKKSEEDSSKDSSKDSSDADDLKSEAAFAVAIDSLLTASAALDSVGMEKSAAFSLKLASIVVEAKKKDKESKKKQIRRLQ